jgi:hypothetical protein
MVAEQFKARKVESLSFIPMDPIVRWLVPFGTTKSVLYWDDRVLIDWL